MSTSDRRVATLLGHLSPPLDLALTVRPCSAPDGLPDARYYQGTYLTTSYSSFNTPVSIGDVSVRVRGEEGLLEHVPFQVAPPVVGLSSQLPEILLHLRWMMQKMMLKQDMFLIGPPGPLRRWIAFRFCELLQRKTSYVALSRDTTESDLKQRRRNFILQLFSCEMHLGEIVSKTVHYVDQPAVLVPFTLTGIFIFN